MTHSLDERSQLIAHFLSWKLQSKVDRLQKSIDLDIEKSKVERLALIHECSDFWQIQILFGQVPAFTLVSNIVEKVEKAQSNDSLLVLRKHSQMIPCLTLRELYNASLLSFSCALSKVKIPWQAIEREKESIVNAKMAHCLDESKSKDCDIE